MRDSKPEANKIALSIAKDKLDELVALVGDNLDMSVTISKWEYPQPLITLAIRNGATRVFEYLVQRGADLNRKGGDNWTPLLEAISGKRTSMIESLVRNGADIELPGGKATTWPLIEAVLTDDIEVVKLVAARSSPDYKAWASESIVKAAWKLEHRDQIMNILMSK